METSIKFLRIILDFDIGLDEIIKEYEGYCLPEVCGGIDGFSEFKKTISDISHTNFEDKVEFVRDDITGRFKRRFI